ncbi:hypothetical protein ACOME3_001553 [Neoechinorhynchus agilis]
MTEVVQPANDNRDCVGERENPTTKSVPTQTRSEISCTFNDYSHIRYPHLENVHPFLRIASIIDEARQYYPDHGRDEFIQMRMTEMSMKSILTSLPPAGNPFLYHGFSQIKYVHDLVVPENQEPLSYLRIMNNSIKIIYEHISRLYIHCCFTPDSISDVEDMYLHMDTATCLLINLKQYEPNCGIHDRIRAFVSFYREIFIYQAIRLLGNNPMNLLEARSIVKRALQSTPEWLESVFHILVIVDMSFVLKTFIIVDTDYNTLLHYCVKEKIAMDSDVFQCLIALCGSSFQNIKSQTPLDIALRLSTDEHSKSMIKLLARNQAKLSIQLIAYFAEHVDRFRPIDDLTREIQWSENYESMQQYKESTEGNAEERNA